MIDKEEIKKIVLCMCEQQEEGMEQEELKDFFKRYFWIENRISKNESPAKEIIKNFAKQMNLLDDAIDELLTENKLKTKTTVVYMAFPGSIGKKTYPAGYWENFYGGKYE